MWDLYQMRMSSHFLGFSGLREHALPCSFAVIRLLA